MINKMSKIQELVHPRESNIKRIVLSGLCILAVFVSMYVYFVGKIVFDVVARRGAEVSIRNSQSSISSLEVSYFNQIKTITIAQAENIGLSESHDTLYASRVSPSATTVGMVSGL